MVPHIMLLCYVMLRYVTSMVRYARLCDAMSCHVMSCHVMLCYAMLCHVATLCRVISSRSLIIAM